MSNFEYVGYQEGRLFEVDPTRAYSKHNKNQSFSGADIKAVIYLPLLTKASITGKDNLKFKVFADLQTISISSTRSVSPVRVFGRSSPIAYTRGARTFAGSLVFATIRKDPFTDVVDAAVTESFVNASTSLVADQLPPFSVVITACTELGATAIQVIHGITITNYGTTYSIDDMYTETTYTYVATDVTPLYEPNRSSKDLAKTVNSAFSSVSQFVEASLGKAYGTVKDISRKIANDKLLNQVNAGLDLDPYYLEKNPNLGQ